MCYLVLKGISKLIYHSLHNIHMNFPLYHPGFQPKSPTSLADHRIETIAPICVTCSLSMDSCEELVLFRITGFVRHLSSHALPTQIHISYIICQLTYLPCVHACVLKHFCIHPCSRKTLSLFWYKLGYPKYSINKIFAIDGIYCNSI